MSKYTHSRGVSSGRIVGPMSIGCGGACKTFEGQVHLPCKKIYIFVNFQSK